MDVVSAIVDAFGTLEGLAVLDVGCGGGALVGALASRGARMTGVDPDGPAVAVARGAFPSAAFARASAEDLPFGDATFDGVVFLNSLHHVTDPRRGLAEAARVARAGAPVVVVEPLPEGSFFDALRIVEDETEVRTLAQKAVRGVVADGPFTHGRTRNLERVERFDDLDAFLARIVAVDPARAAVVAARRPEVEEAFGRAAAWDSSGYVLRQPLRVDVLVRRG